MSCALFDLLRAVTNGWAKMRIHRHTALADTRAAPLFACPLSLALRSAARRSGVGPNPVNGAQETGLTVNRGALARVLVGGVPVRLDGFSAP